MIRVLRNISVCLWASSLISIPLCFYAMPWLGRLIPPTPAAMGTVLLFYGVTTAGFHFLGSKMILNLIREGMIWDQAGMVEKARKSHERAIRIFDSFLLFPLTGEKTRQELIHALAKFSLGPGDRKTAFGYQASCLYILTNPGDTVLAEPWLKKFLEKSRRSGLNSHVPDELEEQVLTVLARIHHDTGILQTLLSEVFLCLGRTDFFARQLYAGIMDRPELRKGFQTRIERLLTTSIQVPGQTGPGFGERIPIKQEQGHPQTRGADESGPLEKRGGLFSAKKKMSGVGKATAAACARGINILTLTMRGLMSVSASFISFVYAAMAKIWNREKSWTYVRSGIMGILAFFVLIFIINTVSHVQHPSGVERGTGTIEAQIPKPFTIQVAAYLKQSHADRYLNILKKKGLDAQVEKVTGGGKTWYVIRVSRFPDKKSAEAYGSQLKEQKIIEDFFVSNR